jgi:hypothetical protein
MARAKKDGLRHLILDYTPHRDGPGTRRSAVLLQKTQEERSRPAAHRRSGRPDRVGLRLDP